MTSWKTTITGILSIIVAVLGAGLTFLKTGVTPDFGVLIAAIVAGVGLITAKDSTAK